MIELLIKQYLETILNKQVCIGEKPRTKEPEYIVIESLNAGRVNGIDAVTLNLYSYATDMASAAVLNLEVKEAMFNAISIPEVSSSRLGGGGQNIDQETKTYCYESVFNLFYNID